MRINEVLPSGKSWYVSYGLLNLTHRDGDEHPEPMTPGKEYDVKLVCKMAAHRFKKGSRIRVAVTESLWPMAWPSPRPVTLTIVTGESLRPVARTLGQAVKNLRSRFRSFATPRKRAP